MGFSLLLVFGIPEPGYAIRYNETEPPFPFFGSQDPAKNNSDGHVHPSEFPRSS